MADSKTGLDPKAAETVLKANYRNLVRKVQEGKTLSAGEVNLLQAIQAGGKAEVTTYAKNQAELAEILGVSRKTIQRAMKMDGHPTTRPDGRLEVGPWREFLGREDLDETGGMTPTELKARNLLLQNERLELQIAVMRKDYLPAVDVEKWGGEIGAAVRKVVSGIHRIAPSIVGLSVADAEARLKDLEQEVMEQLHTLGDRIETARNEPVS